jgi:hypothetical protein
MMFSSCSWNRTVVSMLLTGKKLNGINCLELLPADSLVKNVGIPPISTITWILSGNCQNIALFMKATFERVIQSWLKESSWKKVGKIWCCGKERNSW